VEVIATRPAIMITETTSAYSRAQTVSNASETPSFLAKRKYIAIYYTIAGRNHNGPIAQVK